MPQKIICYGGPGSIVKNGNHTLKQFRKVFKKNKNDIVLGHESCAIWKKEQKCRSCKIFNKIKLLPRKLTKKDERIWDKCDKCKKTGVKPCSLKKYIEFVGAETIKCPNPESLSSL